MLSLTEIAALGLAAARGTQLIVHDSLLDPARVRMQAWHADKADSKFRTFWVDLASCIYCTGFHLAWITLLVYLLAAGKWSDSPWIIHGVEAFAVAAVQMAVNRWDDSLGGGNP